MVFQDASHPPLPSLLVCAHLVRKRVLPSPHLHGDGGGAGLVDDLHAVLGGGDRQLLTPPEDSVLELVPRLGHIGVDAKVSAQHPHDAEAVHHALPQPAVGRGMDARVGGVGIGIIQVDEAGL